MSSLNLSVAKSTVNKNINLKKENNYWNALQDNRVFNHFHHSEESINDKEKIVANFNNNPGLSLRIAEKDIEVNATKLFF